MPSIFLWLQAVILTPSRSPPVATRRWKKTQLEPSQVNAMESAGHSKQRGVETCAVLTTVTLHACWSYCFSDTCLWFDLLSQAGMCQRCAKVLIHSLIHLFTQTEDPTRQVIQVSYAIGHGTIQRRQPMDWILPASWDLQSSSLRWRKHAFQSHDERQPNFAKFGCRSSWRWIACFLQRIDGLWRSQLAAAAACFASCLDL